MANKNELELLEDVLAAYGGDRTRWPAPVRLELSQLIANSPEAASKLAEAEALDRLLDAVPSVSDKRLGALADRIMIEAARTPRLVTSGDGPSTSRQMPVARPVPRWTRHAAGISALAASLVIGLLAGQNPKVVPAVSEIASAVGIDSLSEGTRVAGTDETDVSLDEDML